MKFEIYAGVHPSGAPTELHSNKMFILSLKLTWILVSHSKCIHQRTRQYDSWYDWKSQNYIKSFKGRDAILIGSNINLLCLQIMCSNHILDSELFVKSLLNTHFGFLLPKQLLGSLPMFIQRQVGFSAFFTLLVGWHASTISLPVTLFWPSKPAT